MSEHTPLKPCPFCGNYPECELSSSDVYCKECDFWITDKSLEVAIKRWNNRPTIAKLIDENKRLREALEKTLKLIKNRQIYDKDAQQFINQALNESE